MIPVVITVFRTLSVVVRLAVLGWLAYLIGLLTMGEVKVLGLLPRELGTGVATTLEPHVVRAVNLLFRGFTHLEGALNIVPQVVVVAALLGVGWSLAVDYRRWTTPTWRPGMAVRGGLTVAWAGVTSTLVHGYHRVFGDYTYSDVILSLRVVRVVAVRALEEKQALYLAQYKRTLDYLVDTGGLTRGQRDELVQTKLSGLNHLLSDDYLVGRSPAHLVEAATEIANLHAAVLTAQTVPARVSYQPWFNEVGPWLWAHSGDFCKVALVCGVVYGAIWALGWTGSPPDVFGPGPTGATDKAVTSLSRVLEQIAKLEANGEANSTQLGELTEAVKLLKQGVGSSQAGLTQPLSQAVAALQRDSQALRQICQELHGQIVQIYHILTQ